ncbi:hypothetical protein ACHAXH_008350 [Discostella pseudostelligera]|jgi:hypothetical protein
MAAAASTTTSSSIMTSFQQRSACLAIALLSINAVESFSYTKINDIIQQTPLSLVGRGTTSPSSVSVCTTISSTRRFAASSETETDAQIRDRILHEIDAGLRSYTQSDMKLLSDYGEPEDALALEDDDDDAIDASTLGQWDESDLQDKFDYEWFPELGDADPNNLDTSYEYVETIPLDEEGNEVGYNPIFGPSNPIDGRTILNPPDSYVIDEKTRDDRLVPQDFPDGDPERDANAQITAFRKSLRQVETYTDPYLKMEVPRHTAKWHGYPEQLSYPKKEYMNNRFTKPEDKTDFDALGPALARKVAVQMARAKNNEWLPAGTSASYHASKIAIYKEKGVITGSTLSGDVDESIVTKIQPALDVLGDVVELLSIEVGTVFRFKYHGLIKNKRGMEAWAGVLIRNCDVECTGVVFETGYRKRDPAYDGGDRWYGPY